MRWPHRLVFLPHQMTVFGSLYVVREVRRGRCLESTQSWCGRRTVRTGFALCFVPPPVHVLFAQSLSFAKLGIGVQKAVATCDSSDTSPPKEFGGKFEFKCKFDKRRHWPAVCYWFIYF